MLNNFIYAKKKSLFEEALNNGEVLDEAIVFIEDNKEIWNHGTYFDCSDKHITEENLNEVLSEYVKTSELPIKNVNSSDNILSILDNIIQSNLSYTRGVHEGKDCLILKGKNDIVIGYVPVEDFVIDGMLKNVELEDNKLIFTFNVEVDLGETTTKTIEVNLENYIDVYTGDGTFVEVENNVIKLVNPFTTNDKNKLDTALQPEALNGYVTETELNNKGYLTSHQDLSDYATKQWVEDKNYLTEHQDLSHLVLKSEIPTVPTKVSDLDNDSNFITISDIPSLDLYVTETELSQKGYLTDHLDISHLAEKSEIPSLEGYVTETALNEKGYLTEHQSLDNYYTKDEINQQLGDINSILESIING